MRAFGAEHVEINKFQEATGAAFKGQVKDAVHGSASSAVSNVSIINYETFFSCIYLSLYLYFCIDL